MKKNIGKILCLVCALVLSAACVAAAVLNVSQLNWGLDFAGGTRTTLSVQNAGDEKIQDIVSARLTALGVKGQRVSLEGDQLLIDVASNQDAADAIDVAAQHGRAELVRLDSISDAEALAKITSGGTGVKLEEGTYVPTLSGAWFDDAQVVRSQSSLTYGVTLTLTTDALKVFGDATEELASVGGQMAFVVDGEVISAPSVNQKMSERQVTIQGLSLSQARKVAALLGTDELDANLTVSGTSDVAPAIDASGLVAVAAVAGVVVVAAGIALVVWGKSAGLAAWLGWVVAALVDLGGLVTLVVPGNGFVPSLLNYALVAVGALFSLAAFVVVARRVRTGQKTRLLRSSWRELGCEALCLALFSLAALFLSGVNWSVMGAVLMAAPAWVVGLVLVQLPLRALTAPAAAAPAKAAPKTPKKKSA